MRMAICDDDAACLEQVKTISQRYAAGCGSRSLSVDAFAHPEDLLEAAEKIGGYDIYILDVVMPGMNGIALGQTLREKGYDGKIVYLTSSDEYSLDAFRVRAFDYLLKPVQEQQLCRAVEEVMALLPGKKERFLLVKTRDRSIKLTFDSILYAELNRRSVTYYLTGGRVVESISLRGSFTEAVAELLEDRRFCLCSVGMVVNLDRVTEIESGAVVFGDTCRAFLSEKYCRKLRSAWSEYLFCGEV
jgi:DNA-binding LytR/AlgR family response regulator